VVWTEDNFVAYVQDPSDFVRQATGNGAARSSMSFRVRNETDARDLYAYLLQLGQ
jgi:cytochrome c